MQSTAMGEAIYLALFIWAVVYLSEAMRGNVKALTKCGLCLTGACLTRYDGWVLAVAMAGTVVIVHLLHTEATPAELRPDRRHDPRRFTPVRRGALCAVRRAALQERAAAAQR